jgi:hypothetical protein
MKITRQLLRDIDACQGSIRAMPKRGLPVTLASLRRWHRLRPRAAKSDVAELANCLALDAYAWGAFHAYMNSQCGASLRFEDQWNLLTPQRQVEAIRQCLALYQEVQR